MGVCGYFHARAALPPGLTRSPLYRRLGGPQSGLDGTKNLVPSGMRSPHHPARSESLYRLRYAGPQRYYIEQNNINLKYHTKKHVT